MKFIIKLFPEITIKSAPVRLRYIKILSGNIRHILKQQLFVHDPELITVLRQWDHIVVRSKDPARYDAVCEALQHIPGIHHILWVEESPFHDLQDIFQQTLRCYQAQLENKTFCVRVKRRGQHDFSSIDVERYVGGGLNQHIASAQVKLTAPDITVQLEIDNDQLWLIKGRYNGLSGFPVGTQEDVLSLISGGFDSGVSSYLLMRRGCRVHYCFFNLGGDAHEAGVRQMACHLWQRYGSSHRVRFVSVNFAEVVGEILQQVEDGQMGVVLKRMMVRAAAQIAQRYGVQALVTGEALGQVSSQTLSNLRLIDNVTDTLILRPLIACDKQQIIDIARQIGTESYAASMPEYCAVISKSPTVKAIQQRIEAQEAGFNFAVLENAVATAVNLDIKHLIELPAAGQPEPVEIVSQLSPGDMLLDIRGRDEQQQQPLHVAGAQVLAIPFYKLARQFADLDQSKTWLLWCEQGVMSRLQAAHLQAMGYHNVKVYRPATVPSDPH